MPKVNLPDKYSCQVTSCTWKFRTTKDRTYHMKRYHPIARQSNTEVQDEQDDVDMTDVHPSINDTSRLNENERIAYHMKSTEAGRFTKTELFSMKFTEIVDTYAIPREAVREIVYLVRSLIKDNVDENCISLDKIPSTLMFPDTLEAAMKKKTEVKARSHQVCKKGCMLFGDDDQETLECLACKESRYAANGLPVRKMKMFPVGDLVANMLVNDKTRELMKYRSRYQCENDGCRDYFDGTEYKTFMQNGLFDGENDVALSLFVDGFTATKSSNSAHLTIVHLINLNIPPAFRYQDQYTRQIAILPGPNSPKSLLHTYLKPIVEEFKALSTKGMVVYKDGVEVCRAKVHLVMATGDLPASAELANHMTSTALYGCRICLIQTRRINNSSCFLSIDSELRTGDDFKNPEPNTVPGIRGPTVFKDLVTMKSPFFFSQDELHLICHGVGKTLMDFVTVSLNKPYNASIKLMKGDDQSQARENWPFWIEKQVLMSIGERVEESKETVSSTFGSKWVNPIKFTGGNRAVDYLNFLLYVLPTSFVPYFRSDRTKRIVLKLVKACALCSQWEITTQDLQLIRRNFKDWVNFLLEEIELNRVSAGIMKPTQHYLLHVADTILANGPLRAYSTRSQERSIGKYKKQIKSKSSVGENAGNVMERLTTRAFINNLPWDISDQLELLTSRCYSENSYCQLISVDTGDELQMWEPFFPKSSNNLPLDINEARFIHALNNFYVRVSESVAVSTVAKLLLSGRAWAGDKVYSSILYAKHINEHRRGNSFIMFEATYKTNRNNIVTSWYVGSMVFFFEHTAAEQTRFLIFVELAEENGVMMEDHTIPKVKLHLSSQRPKYAVIRFEDVVCSVSLMKTCHSREYIVISKKVFTQSLRSTAGSIRNL